MAGGRRQIAVIGGGITGAFAAYHLAGLGVDVVLLEPDDRGSNASSNNPGGLNPMHGAGIPGPLADLALESYHLHRDSWAELRRHGRPDFAGRPTTRVDVAFDETEAARLRGSVDRYDAAPDFSALWLSIDELRATEPRLSRLAHGGLVTTGNLRVDAAAYTRAVTRAALAAGVREVRAEVMDLKPGDGAVSAVLTDIGEIECDGVVVATGPWCAEPARWLGVSLPVEPVRGELLLVDQLDPVIDHDICHGRYGIYPTSDGRLWLGGTDDRVGFDATPSSSGRAAILDAVRRLAPGVAPGAILRHTAALRPVGADGLPIAGIAPGWSNVALALGGGRKGMLLSAGLARAAAELLVLGRTDVPIEACRSDRPGLAA